MADYSRKQNTDSYHVRIERQLTKGEEVLRKIRAEVDVFEDLVKRNEEVEQWLSASREELTRIYIDEDITTPLKVTTGLDLEEISWQEAIESLEAILSERMAALNEIRRLTRVHDGKG